MAYPAPRRGDVFARSVAVSASDAVHGHGYGDGQGSGYGRCHGLGLLSAPAFRFRERWLVVVRASRPQDGRLPLRFPWIPLAPSIGSGLLGRPWRPSVAQSAWSFGGNGEGVDHADCTSGGLIGYRKTLTSSW